MTNSQLYYFRKIAHLGLIIMHKKATRLKEGWLLMIIKVKIQLDRLLDSLNSAFR